MSLRISREAFKWVIIMGGLQNPEIYPNQYLSFTRDRLPSKNLNNRQIT